MALLLDAVGCGSKLSSSILKKLNILFVLDIRSFPVALSQNLLRYCFVHYLTCSLSPIAAPVSKTYETVTYMQLSSRMKCHL